MSLCRSTETLTRDLEPWLVEHEYDYVDCDGEGRRLELVTVTQVIARRWLPDRTTESVIVRTSVAMLSHAEELSALLAKALTALDETPPPDAPLADLLDASLARLGYTGS